jgi:hypothetical protein
MMHAAIRLAPYLFVRLLSDRLSSGPVLERRNDRIQSHARAAHADCAFPIGNQGNNGAGRYGHMVNIGKNQLPRA